MDLFYYQLRSLEDYLPINAIPTISIVIFAGKARILNIIKIAAIIANIIHPFPLWRATLLWWFHRLLVKFAL